MFGCGAPDPVRDPLLWRTHYIAAGESLVGISVGPLVCPQVHWLRNRSTPCLRALTEGALRCPCETEVLAVRRIAYLPLVSSDGERVVTVLSNNCAAKLGNLAHRTALRINRPKTPCAPLVAIRVRDFDVPGLAIKKADKLQPQDIREYLCRLWNIDSLTRWWADRAAHSPADQVETSAPAPEPPREEPAAPPPVLSGADTNPEMLAIRARLRAARQRPG